MTTILEALQNAKINLVDNGGQGLIGIIGKNQLRNAVLLLEKNYPLETEIDPLLETYPQLVDAPEFKEYSDE